MRVQQSRLSALRSGEAIDRRLRTPTVATVCPRRRGVSAAEGAVSEGHARRLSALGTAHYERNRPRRLQPASRYAASERISDRGGGTLRRHSHRSFDLAGSELLNLGSVLADDPFRALQSLPGVGAYSDFQGQFTLRGASHERIGIYLDGILLFTSPFMPCKATTTPVRHWACYKAS